MNQYFYINQTKKHLFSVGLFGEDSSMDSIGKKLGARAFGLLCSEIGSWYGDSVCISDRSLKDFNHYLDITIEAELFLIDCDGIKIVESVIDDSMNAFIQTCFYAQVQQRADIINFLNTRYGKNVWQKTQKDFMKNRTDHFTCKFYEARDRGLVLKK